MRSYIGRLNVCFLLMYRQTLKKKHWSVYQAIIEYIVLPFSIPDPHKISWTLIMTNYTLAYSDADEIFTLPLYSCYSLGAVKSFRVWWWCISYMFTLIEVLPIVLIFVMECKKPGSIKKGSKHIYFIHCIVIWFKFIWKSLLPISGQSVTKYYISI